MDQNIFQFSKPSFLKFVPYLVLDWIGISAGILLFYHQKNVIGFFLASIIIGHFQHSLAILGHEAVHFRISKNRTLNEWIGRIFCFFPVTITVSTYRDFHFPHHKSPNGIIDPEIPIRKAMGKNWVAPFSITRGIRLWTLSFIGFSLRELAIFSFMLPSGSKKEKILLTTYWSVIGYCAYRFQAASYLGLWFYAIATTYFSKLRVQAWYEHSLDTEYANRYQLPNTFYRLIFPHNIWVHYEHHKYPTVPFYHLENVRTLDENEKIYTFKEMNNKIRNNLNASQATKAA
ncbi:MAG: fatty acid desaturase [Oligoflexia bacterium]|nr:fatty acid desaturase [Oligoflexia bacterium]